MKSGEEQLIDQVENSFHDAWNSGDAKKIGSFFTDDGIRVGPDGVIQHGRNEIEEVYDKLLKVMPGSTIKYEPGITRILCDDFATWQCKLEITQVGDKAVIHGYSFDLLKKVDGQWQILEAHPKMIGSLPV
jgi:uncharacterized protein (TIGR02246 family)